MINNEEGNYIYFLINDFEEIGCLEVKLVYIYF